MRFYTGDAASVLKKFPDKYVDLVVTSPPYDNIRRYKGFSFNFETIAGELYRVMKDGGVVVWVCGDSTVKGTESGTSFRQALYFKDIGFRLHDTMIYRKLNYPPLTHNRYEQSFEYMFVFSKGKPKTFNPIRVPTAYPGAKKDISKYKYNLDEKGHAMRWQDTVRITGKDKIKGNVWSYTTGGGNSTKDVHTHPAIFPEALARDHIESWSNPGDLILDPFSGSGTTAKMSLLTGRRFIGIDISREYNREAASRIYAAYKESDFAG